MKQYKLYTVEGYTWKLKIYCRKEDRNNAKVPHSEDIVMTLMEDILMAGRTLYVDNFYTSLSLTQALLRKNTFLCGTLRCNRKGNPKQVCDKKLKRGEIYGMENKDGIRVTKWLDKRAVLIV